MNKIENYNNFYEFFSLFNNIKKMGYVKSLYNDIGAGGRTFEILVGKKADKKQLPDYKNIELKVQSFNTKYDLTLFSLIPKSCDKGSSEMLSSIIKLIGHKGVNNKKYKYFNKKIIVGKSYLINCFILKSYIDYNNKKIIIEVIEYNGTILERIYWTFDCIEKVIITKLKYLALIRARSKYIKNTLYYNYDKINLYSLKKIDYFFNAIDKGIVYVSFNIGCNLENNEIKYHGITFNINTENLEHIYDEVKL